MYTAGQGWSFLAKVFACVDEVGCKTPYFFCVLPSFFAAAACNGQTDLLLIVDGFVITRLNEIKSCHIMLH